MKSAVDALLVEDNPSDATLLKTLISASDLAQPVIHHTERFNQALLALEENTFDIIVLDLCLPDGWGIDLVKQLKAQTPQIPIIVLSGIQDQSLAKDALREGAQDYLSKADMFSPERIAKLGHIDVGNLLIKTLQHAIERTELTRQLESSRERYALAVKGSNDGIWDWNLKTNEIYYSNRWQTMLGFGQGCISNHPNEWLSRIHPDDRDPFNHQLQQHLSQQQPQFCCEYRICDAAGHYRWMLTRGLALWDKTGKAYRIAGSQTDMTDRKQLEQDLYQEKELAQITLNSIGDAVITTDACGKIKDFNPVAERLTGWNAREARQKSISEVCNIIDSGSRKRLRNPAIRAMEEQKTVSLSNHPTLLSRTGEEFAIGDSAAPIRSANGEIVGTVLVFHDVTEERGRAQQLVWQASHDSLTHLYNRKKFMQALEDIIQDALINQSQHILCCMDLDHFKAVNDTCGHAAGDELLRQVADLWRKMVRRSDVLARLGGDEFGLLLYDCDPQRAQDIATDFCNVIQSFRFVYDGKIFNIGVSIGVVPITAQNSNTEQVMKLADAACYTAKHKGRNRVQVYQPDDNDIVQQSIDSQWFARITQALDHDLFCLYTQSILSANADRTKPQLCEVLLRLPNAYSGQIIPPQAFIPAAERYGLMPKIDRWVVEHLLTYLANQQSTVAKSAPSSDVDDSNNIIYCINLSGASLNDDNFVQFLTTQLSDHPISPKRLCFEITETVAISNLQAAADFILELKKLGCYFALDDFGSGMSSFTYLRHLPVDYLKIDGNFVREAPHDDVMQAMLESINHIGHVMGLQTVAEYVEDPNILDIVQTLKVDYVQGYGIDLPTPLIPSA